MFLCSVARSSQRRTLRWDGAWPASSSQFCGHTCVPFAPPDVSGPPTNEMFGQTPYEGLSMREAHDLSSS